MSEDVCEIEKTEIEAMPNDVVIKKKHLKIKGKDFSLVCQKFGEMWNE